MWSFHCQKAWAFKTPHRRSGRHGRSERTYVFHDTLAGSLIFIYRSLLHTPQSENWRPLKADALADITRALLTKYFHTTEPNAPVHVPLRYSPHPLSRQNQFSRCPTAERVGPFSLDPTPPPRAITEHLLYQNQTCVVHTHFIYCARVRLCHLILWCYVYDNVIVLDFCCKEWDGDGLPPAGRLFSPISGYH